MTKVLPGVGVDTTEEGPQDVAGNAVINADLIFDDGLAPGAKRKKRKGQAVGRFSFLGEPVG